MFLTLQSYRGLAALAVAAFHLSIGLGDPRYFGTQVLSSVTWRMDLGVDFFFVLSGFIIMMAHRKDIGQPSRLPVFFEKRFTRIYPVYWIYTGVFCLLVALGFGAVTQNPDTAAKWTTVATLIRFENFLLPISPAWTLIHEIAFYLVFATLILNRRFGIVVFAAWQIACIVLFQYPSPDERTPFATYFAAYNIDFAIGVAVFVLYHRRMLHAPLAWLLSGVALLALTLTFEGLGYPFAGYKLSYALAFGAIILGSVTWEAGRKSLRIPLLPFLGDASYTIYLTHNPIEGVLAKIAMRVLPGAATSPYLVYVVVLVLTVAAGCLAHLLVERPVLSLARHAFGRRAHRMATT